MKEIINFNTDIKFVTETFGEFTEGQEQEKKFLIRGVALDAGVSRNKVRYMPEEMAKAAESMIGKPVLNGHNADDIKAIIGKVIKSEFLNNQILFEAEMDKGEEKINRKLEQGLINKVSIGASYDDHPHEDGSGIITPTGISFEELSLVAVPGVPTASIHQVIAEKFKLKGDKMEETKLNELTEKINALEKSNASLVESQKLKEQEEEAVVEAEKEVAETEKKEEATEKFKTEILEKINKLETKLSEKSIVNSNPTAKEENKFNLVREKGLVYSKTPELLY